MTMLHIAALDIAKTKGPNDISDFLTNAAWTNHSTYHILLKDSLGAAIFGWDMLVNISLFFDWNKIGEHR